MRKKLPLLLILTALMASCSNQSSNNESAGLNPDSTETVLSYDPAEYYEEVTDTILDSALQLRIKRYTLMDKGFEVPFEFGPDKRKIIHFRDFATDLELISQNNVVFSETIQKEDFSDKIDDVEFLPLAYLSWSALDSYNTETGEVNLRMMIVMIESDYAYSFMYTVDKQGNKRVQLID